MVRDSASEEESRYLAVNSYLPKYSSIRKGAIFMGRFWQVGWEASRTKLSGWTGEKKKNQRIPQRRQRAAKVRSDK
jgi:hypothetical protein